MLFATLGSATNVPAPRRRTRYPSRTSPSSAARTVSRETPRSRQSWRSEGIAAPTSSPSISSQHLVAGLALLGQCATSSGTPSAASREPVCGSKKWNRRGVDGELDDVADPRRRPRVDPGREQGLGRPADRRRQPFRAPRP